MSTEGGHLVPITSLNQWCDMQIIDLASNCGDKLTICWPGESAEHRLRHRLLVEASVLAFFYQIFEILNTPNSEAFLFRRLWSHEFAKWIETYTICFLVNVFDSWWLIDTLNDNLWVSAAWGEVYIVRAPCQVTHTYKHTRLGLIISL